MWADRLEELIENRLMVKSIPPIFFLSGRFRETRLTPKSPWNIDSGADRHWRWSFESTRGYTNTVTTHFSHCHDRVHDENTFLRFLKNYRSPVFNDFNIDFHHFVTLTPSITTQYRLDPWENVLSHILTPVQSLWTQNMIRLSPLTLFWGELSVLQRKPPSENPFRINISRLYE